VLNELSSTSTYSDGGEHAFAFSQARILTFFLLNVHAERLAFEEQLKITIMLQDRVGSGLVQHALESLPSGLDKLGVEAANSLLLRWRRDDNTRVVTM